MIYHFDTQPIQYNTIILKMVKLYKLHGDKSRLCLIYNFLPFIKPAPAWPIKIGLEPRTGPNNSPLPSIDL